jgi:AcrR family transcriptional regulator
MTVSDRRARHRASLRREILDAASVLFVEQGYDRVTMRRVAEKIDYSPTTIYLYFKDKRELFAAICDETFSQLSSKLERLKPPAGTPGTPNAPLGLLRESLKAYVEFGTSHPNHYAVAFLQTQEISADFAFEQSIGARAFGFLREVVQACVAAGTIRTGNVETTAQSLWAAVHGVTALLITMKGFPFVSRAALVDHTVDTLIAGLKPTAAPRAAASRQAASLSFLD